MNKLLIFSYIISYFLYILFGHRFIRNIIYQQENKEYSKSIGDIIFRGYYLCYIALLYNAYYFYNPTVETFYNALMINLVSIVSYGYKYGNKQIDGVIVHLLYSLPVILFKQKRSNNGFGWLTVFTFILLLNYMPFCNVLLHHIFPYMKELDYVSSKNYCNYT